MPAQESANKVTNEMSPVRSCSATQCSYNVNKNCHAKAITVGDGDNPGCDTYFHASNRIRETRRMAGVGACKVSSCKFNEDFECSAQEITVGMSGSSVRCMTFTHRA